MVAVVHGFPSKFHALQCTSLSYSSPFVVAIVRVYQRFKWVYTNATYQPVEYAWQHPYNSRFTKERLCELKGKTGVGAPRSLKRKLIELHELLHLQPWTHFPLTVSYTSECTCPFVYLVDTLDGLTYLSV